MPPSRLLLVSSAIVLFVGIFGVVVLHEIRDKESSPEENPLLYAEVSTTSPSRIVSTGATTTPGTIDLPIIVYHIVRPSYPSDSAAVRSIAVTPEIFDAQMHYLKDAGYQVVQFSDLENNLASGAPLPAHPVILSFDDGWSDQFKYAFPILQKYHYPTTFFVFTNAIGRRGFLSWDNLRALISGGMVIGAHSHSHPYLTKITSIPVLWDEIDGSKQLLEKKLGVSVTEFAYPFGQYNQTIVSLVRKAGYRSARGDYYSGEQSFNRLFTLSAMNAPTTTAKFEERLRTASKI